MTKATELAGRRATAVGDPRVVVPKSVEVAAVLSERVRHRDVQLRRAFVRRGKSTRPTPLMHMLRGGRGGVVRAKLYLSLLWMAVGEGHSVTYPARTWATLLGLADPDTRGSRRVTEALAWLAEESFVEIHGGSGAPLTVVVKSERGDGSRYSVPGASIKRLQEAGRPIGREVYDKVPRSLWTNGWLPLLSGPELACFLVLLSARQAASDSADSGSWFASSLLADRYDMSDDTRQRGMRGLRDLGIVSVKPIVVGRSSVDYQRSRKQYKLLLERLDASPPLETLK
ncbi:hypothetical protein [Nocardioides sp.]|uniref:hypothetical protein n=1 Tax=Nocardioides sp. TaxID=35761 RepID=UPI002610AAFC|nr:hypothetical protein [Nocardioides sp.]MDI6912110.1 hypothetical protein [Nocardioides sp.]